MTQERLDQAGESIWYLAREVFVALSRPTHDTERTGDELAGALGALRLLELGVEDARRATVTRMRNLGCSWQAIGDGLGMTRQAAQQRYGEEVTHE